MADATLKKILRLSEPDRPTQVRRSAVLILGELGQRDEEVSEALCALLDDSDAELRTETIAAIGKLHIEKALPRLLDRVAEGGPESVAAAQAAARMSAKGSRALNEMMDKVPPGIRRRIAAALAGSGNVTAESLAVHSLLNSDPGVVEAAVGTLAASVPSLKESHRKTLVDQLLEMLQEGKQHPLSQVSEAAIVRLLAVLHDPRAESALWERLKPMYDNRIRSAAIQALGSQVESPGKERLKLLIECACDVEFQIVATALVLLRSIPTPDKGYEPWLKLFEAPTSVTRRFAIERLGDRTHAVVLASLIAQFDHSDRSLRDASLSRLVRHPAGQEALVQALLNAETPDRAWDLAKPQSAPARTYPSELFDLIFQRACRYLDAGDKRADPLVFLCKEANLAAMREGLASRGLALRKKKQYEKAVAYLRLLTRDPAVGLEVRFESACCHLKLSARDLATEARASDPCLEQFDSLLRAYPKELLEKIETTKWLEPEELFYLGFHFAEKDRQEKAFGGELLKLVIRRSPKTQLAKDAKNKLKSAAIE